MLRFSFLFVSELVVWCLFVGGYLFCYVCVVDYACLVDFGIAEWLF